MAPIAPPDIEAASVLVSLAGFVVAIVLFITCAKTESKPQQMKKVDNFSSIDRNADNNKNDTLQLRDTVPLTSPTSSTVKKKMDCKPQKLLFDSTKLLREAFKDDRILSKLTVKEHQLELVVIIGEGNFGLVYKGTLVDEKGNNPQPVAVKSVQGPKCTKEDTMEFIRESARMRGLEHQNVLSIIGVLMKENRPFIILPYMENGDLKQYIADKNKKFTVEALLHLGFHVAKGMEYLSNKNFIHRDLAARNCMVSKEGVVKVADFGLTRDLYESDYYSMSNMSTPLPVRWVALESILTGKFTLKSDVWSFGVLLWELLTRGINPYNDIKNNMDVVRYLQNGLRLESPAYVGTPLRDLMKMCWLKNPNQRPTFSKICDSFRQMLRN